MKLLSLVSFNRHLCVTARTKISHAICGAFELRNEQTIASQKYHMFLVGVLVAVPDFPSRSHSHPHTYTRSFLLLRPPTSSSFRPGLSVMRFNLTEAKILNSTHSLKI